MIPVFGCVWEWGAPQNHELPFSREHKWKNHPKSFIHEVSLFRSRKTSILLIGPYKTLTIAFSPYIYIMSIYIYMYNIHMMIYIYVYVCVFFPFHQPIQSPLGFTSPWHPMAFHRQEKRRESSVYPVTSPPKLRRESGRWADLEPLELEFFRGFSEIFPLSNGVVMAYPNSFQRVINSLLKEWRWI